MASPDLWTIAQQHHRAGNLSEAIACYRQLLTLQPNQAQVHNNLGVALRAQGQLDAALYHYRQAIALQPTAGAHNNLGNLLRQQGKPEDAIACYEQALRLQADYPDALISLAQLHREQGRFEQAIALMQRAIALRPDDPDAHNNLGNALQGVGKFAQAIVCYQTALQLRPHSPAFYNNLGAAFQELGRFEESIAAYQQALQLQPGYADAYYNLGNVLKDQDRFAESVAAYQQALRLQPRYPEAYNNLGLALFELGKLEEAIAAYSHALSLQPDYPDARLNRGLSRLMAGDLRGGFADYEWRWQVRGKNFKPPRPFAQPLWDGSDFTGQTILLHAEQGYGDTIQFIRYVPLVAQRGGRVIVECQEALIRLLQPLSAMAELLPTGAPLPAFDVHAPLLSLPHLLGTTLETIPAAPYLHPPSSALKLDTEDEALKVGIVWAGSPEHQNDRRRSCPFSQFQALLDVPGVRFYSLQKGARAADLGDAAVTDLASQLSDFADTAAAIAQLDLVISVDTAVAHVAGAIGCPAWLLLSFAPDWRWLQQRADTPWYPTLRLFRPTAPGDWASVVAQAKAALLHQLGLAAYRAKRLAIASRYFQQAVALDANSPATYNNLGVTLRQQGRHAEAIDCYRQALKLHPDDADTHYNLANALRDLDRLAAAVQHYQRALALAPNSVEAWINLGNARKSQGQLQAAIACYERGLAIDPSHASAHNNLGHALLQAGDLQRGFAENEWRWRVQNYQLPRPPLPQPLWDGSALAGRRILLYAEQGLGDTMQFIRYVPLVAERGGVVLVECQPSLVPLIQPLASIEQVIPRGEPLPDFDIQAPLLSLPHLLGTSLDTVPAPIPYLSAPKSELKLEPTDCLKVGIVWAGSPTNRSDRHRSCPFDRWQPLFDLPDIAFYSLQKGSRAADAQSSTRVIDLSDRLVDFGETAAAIAQLDLVISVDTAVAHLAGAMGKPVWLLLGADPDWRWMLGRLDSPWYPSMRLFRQSVPGDWDSTIAAMVGELRRSSAQPVSIAAVAPAPIRVGIGWQIGPATGWGIYGTHLALHLLRSQRFDPIALLPPATGTPLQPLHQQRLQPIFRHGQAIVQRGAADFPVLKGLGNQFATAPELESLGGSKTAGVIFFEDTQLSPQALERAKAFDRIIAGSSWNAAVLRSCGITPVDTVFQGIDPTVFHPAPRSQLFADRFVVFSGGKLEYRKGQDIVVAAFRAFHARHPDALLLTAWHNFWAKTMTGLEQAGHVHSLPAIAADGRLALAPWLIGNGIPDTAFIDLGIVPNALMGQLLREADAAVFPNRCEGGTNLAAMEALACGVPTLLSANTGHLDLLGDHCYVLRSQRPVRPIDLYRGYEGWGESEVEEVVEALEEVYQNRGAAQQRGAAAAQFMRDWTWAQQVDRLLPILMELAEAN